MHEHFCPSLSLPTTQERLGLSRRGLICGPDEEEYAFLKRAEAAAPKGHNSSEWKLAEKRVCELFECAPDWVEIEKSSKGLFFWEGAAIEISESGSVMISVRKSALMQKFYPEEELLAHEAVHAARASFQEERFEEHFAFLTSKSAFRRFFGPLFRGAHEVRRLGACAALSLGGVLFMPFWQGAELLLFAPFVALSYLLVRLFHDKRTLKRALGRAAPLLKDKALVLPFLFRLSDEEIAFFANRTSQEIEEYVRSKECSRWEMIKSQYWDTRL